jgi:hypothetical protein
MKLQQSKVARVFLFALLALGSFFMSTKEASATHAYGGQLKWQQAGGNTIQFNFTSTWRRSFFGSPTVGQTISGVGTLVTGYPGAPGLSIVPVVTAVDAVNDQIYTTWTGSYTYPATGNYTAQYDLCCRISSLLDGNNDQNIRLQTIVNVGPPYNNPPVSAFPTIVFVSVGQAAATFNIPGSDPDGNTLTYRLSTNAESSLVTPAPVGLTLSSNGVVTMNTTTRSINNRFAVQVMIQDGLTKTPVDFIIQMVGVSAPPIFIAPTPIAPNNNLTVLPGTNLTFTVAARDNDAGSTVRLNPITLPPGATMSPVLPVTGAANATVTSTFSWTPTASQVGSYVLTFPAVDNVGVQTLNTVNITVPCPLDVQLATLTTGCNVGVNATPSNFSSSANLLYTWTGPNGFTASTQNISNLASGTYSLRVNDVATGCLVVRNINVISPTPTATITAGGPTSNCTSSPVVLTAPSVPASSTGNAMTFGGRYASAPHTAANNLGAGTTYTIESWVRVTDNVNNTIVDKGDYNYLFQTHSNGNQGLGLYNRSFGWIYSAGTVPVNQWVHVAVTYDNRTVKFYQNGVLQGTYTAVANSTGDNGPLNIGRQSPSTCACNIFDGSMDELRLWNVAKSQSDIQASMNATVPTNSAGLVAYYKFDEGTGTTISDATANTNTATMVGTPIWQVPSTSPLGGVVYSYLWSPGGQTTQSINATTSGTYSVTVTNTTQGCFATSAPTTVTINQTPTITCPANIAVSNTPGQCGAVVNFTGGSATGLPAPTVTYSPASGSFFPIGTSTVTATATNSCGTVSCTFTVTVTDTEGPQFTTPASILTPTNPQGAVNATNANGAVVNYTLPVATDNCGTANVVSIPASGSVFAIGTTTVSSVATDAAGNQTISTFDVVVAGSAPQVVCPANITVDAAPGQCGANVNFIATESVGIPASTITYSLQPGSFFPVGTTSVTATASNAVGVSTCTFNVVVRDVEGPTITAPSNITVNATPGQCGAVVTFTAPTAVDNCTLVTSPGNGTFGQGGSGEGPTPNCNGGDSGGGGGGGWYGGGGGYVYSSGAGGSSYTIPSATNVIHTQGWNTGNGRIVLNFNVSPFTQTFNFTGAPQTFVVPVGVTSLTVDVFGAQGGSNGGGGGRVQATIAVIPGETLAIYVGGQGANSSTGVANGGFNGGGNSGNCNPRYCGAGGGGASDIRRGTTLNDRIIVAGGGGGSHPINSTGNAGQGGGTVGGSVSSTGNGCIATYATGGTQTAGGLPSTSSGFCCTVPVTSTVTVSHPSGSTFPVGTTTVTVTARDASNNISTQTFTVTVVDNQQPNISCPSNINVNATSASGAVVNYTAPVGTDNCSGVTTTRTAGLASGSTFPIGTTTVTYTATDAAGLSTSCSFTVTVSGLAPQIVCPSNISVSATPNQCGAVVNFTATETQGIPASTITYSHAPGSLFPVGTTTVTATATNAVGVSTCTFTVTVTDTEFPVIANCPGTITANAAPGQCSAPVSFTLPPLAPTVDQQITDIFTGTVGTDQWQSFTAGRTGLLTQVDLYRNGIQPFNGTLTIYQGVGVSGTVIYSSTYNYPTDNNWTSLPLVQANQPTVTAGQTYTIRIESPVGEFGVGLMLLGGAPSNQGTYYSNSYGLNPGWKLNFRTYVATASPSISATDNCSVTSFTSTHNSGDVFPVGTTPVTFTAVDAAGNTTTCSFNVVVVDNQAPSISCPTNMNVVATSAAGAVANYTAPVGTDNCSGVTTTRTAGLASGSTFPIGTTTVTYTATDAAGLSTSCSFTITVVGVPPAITCPANITLNAANGQCGANVSFAATETAAIPASTITYSHQPGSFFPVGTTTVTATATNAVGVSTCTFTVTVVDNQSPVLVGVPANITVECNAIPSAPSVSATDNCTTSAPVMTEVITSTSMPTSGLKGFWNLNEGAGTTTADQSGFGSTGTLNGGVSWTTGKSGSAVAFPGTGNDYVEVANGTNGALDTRRSISMFAWFIPGTNGFQQMPIIQYNPNGWGTHLWQTGSNQLFVRFTQRNTLAFTNALVANTLIPGQWNCVGATYDYATGMARLWCNGVNVASQNIGILELATNHPLRIGSVNFDGRRTNAKVDNVAIYDRALNATEIANLCANSCPNNYTITRTWSTTDASGNTATASQSITVQDTQAPILSAAPANTTVECNAVPAAATLTATDNCDNAPVVTFAETRTNGNCPSNYTLTRVWTAKDACGNTSSKTQTITVQDTQAPVLSAAPADETVECSAVPAAATLTANDNCDNAPVVTFAETRTNGNCPSNYTLTRVWTATDACGNTSSKTQVITVQDTQAPTLSAAPGDATVECDAVPTAAVLTATDNCDNAPVVTYAESRTNGNCPSNYTLTRVWTATDACGNTSSKTQVITVQDTQAPVLSAAPADVTVSCDAVQEPATLTAMDNCDAEPFVTFNQVSTRNADVNNAAHYNYTITRTWTATDACGNASSKTQVITVQDITNPTITCPASVTVNCQDDNTSSATGVATATDNCSPVAITQSQTSTQSADVNNAAHYNYVITRTWTATDVTGNASSCVQTITVRDITKPIAVCKPVTVTLVGGTVSITPEQVNNGSSDNCSPLTFSLSKTTFNCSNIGNNTVTLTVTDVSGNSHSCTAVVTVVGEIPTCSIASIPTSNVFTGGVSTNLYLGYGAQSTTLQVSAPASGAPYTYSWSGTGLSNNNTANPVFTPTVAGNYTFTVLVTNKYGCTTTCSITICVRDIRVPGTGGKKVYVCHIPPGNTGNPQTLSISVNAVSAHVGLHGGDRLGACDMQPCGATPRYVDAAEHIDHDDLGITVKVSPNPSVNYFLINIKSDDTKTPLTLRVMTASGKLMEMDRSIAPGSTIQVGDRYTSGIYFAEIMQGTKRKVVRLVKGN